MKHLFLWIFFLSTGPVLSAQTIHCLADRYSQDALFDSTEIQVTTNIHYATSMRWPGTEMDSLWMDVYQPDPGVDPLNKRPLILMVHGGAFLVGEKDDMAYFCMEMARRGFVTATISYRLGWDCPATDFAQVCANCQDAPTVAKFRVAMYRGVQDTRAALRYITTFADDYGIDTCAVYLQGESAGSINSLHAAFLQQSEVDTWCPDCVDEVGLLDTTGNNHAITPQIRGVINSCGAVGMLDMVNQETPVISFHDDNDIVVPFGYGSFVNCLIGGNGSNSVRARLTENGVCNELNKIEYLPWPIGPIPQHCAYPRNAIIGKASCFLKNLLCDNCSTTTNTQIWNIPDCSSGGFVRVEEKQPENWVQLNGNKLMLNAQTRNASVEIYDPSMRLLTRLSTTNSVVELPSSLHGCMLVKVDSENHSKEVLKWCNF